MGITRLRNDGSQERIKIVEGGTDMKKRIAGFSAVMMAAVLFFGSLQPVLAAGAEGSATETAAVEAADAVDTAAETMAVEAEPAVPDVDLTGLSSDLMLSEMTNIMANADENIGKRIRTAGILQAFQYNDRYIFSIFLGGASSCCGVTVEFNRAGDYIYPDDYPALGTVVFIEGVLDRYEENGLTYCWLNDAVMSTEKFWEKQPS